MPRAKGRVWPVRGTAGPRNEWECCDGGPSQRIPILSYGDGLHSPRYRPAVSGAKRNSPAGGVVAGEGDYARGS